MTRRERYAAGALGVTSVLVGIGAMHLADQSQWLFLWLIVAGVCMLWEVFHG